MGAGPGDPGLAADVVIHLAFFGLQFMVPALAYSVVNGVAQRTLR